MIPLGNYVPTNATIIPIAEIMDVEQHYFTHQVIKYNITVYYYMIFYNNNIFNNIKGQY